VCVVREIDRERAPARERHGLSVCVSVYQWCVCDSVCDRVLKTLTCVEIHRRI